MKTIPLLLLAAATSLQAQFNYTDLPFLARSAPPAAGLPLTTNFLVYWGAIDYGLTNTSNVSPPANGDSVMDWANKVTTQPNWAHALSGREPLYYSAGGPNGYGRVSMVTTLRELKAYPTANIYPQVVTVFAVLRFTGNQGANSGFVFDSTTAGTRGYCYTILTGSKVELHLGGPAKEFNGASSLTTNTWFLLTCQWNSASSLMRTNGVTYATGDAGVSSLTGWSWGEGVGNAGPLYGDFAEVLMYVTNADLTATETYLKGKYGL